MEATTGSSLKSISLDKSLPQPLYLQLAEQIRRLIEAQQLASGQALPSEREIMQHTAISRVTVRKAINELIHQGILHSRQGIGTFVSEPREQSGDTLTGFSGDSLLRGEKPASQWLKKVKERPSEEEASKLNIDPKDAVIRLSRVRLANNEPLAIEHAVIPAAILPQPELVSESLYQALAQRGYEPTEGYQKIRSSKASSIEAGFLGIQEGTEVLRIERFTQLSDGRPVELTHSVYRGDKYVFVSQLHSASQSHIQSI